MSESTLSNPSPVRYYFACGSEVKDGDIVGPVRITNVSGTPEYFTLMFTYLDGVHGSGSCMGAQRETREGFIQRRISYVPATPELPVLNNSDERDERCETCRFWNQDGKDRYEDEEYHATCQRFPPRPFQQGEFRTAEMIPEWPWTFAQDWCGEWVAIPPAKAPPKPVRTEAELHTACAHPNLSSFPPQSPLIESTAVYDRPPTWTKTPPTSPGWYWYRLPECPITIREIVERTENDGRMWVISNGDPLKMTGEWWPIPVAEPPQ